MTRRKPRSTRAKLEAAAANALAQRYVLKLYVTGATPRSLLAIANIKAICEKHLKGRYELEVVDIYEQPTLARGEQIVAVPTLLRKLPAPVRRLVGDLSKTQQVLLGLDLVPESR